MTLTITDNRMTLEEGAALGDRQQVANLYPRPRLTRKTRGRSEYATGPAFLRVSVLARCCGWLPDQEEGALSRRGSVRCPGSRSCAARLVAGHRAPRCRRGNRAGAAVALPGRRPGEACQAGQPAR